MMSQLSSTERKAELNKVLNVKRSQKTGTLVLAGWLKLDLKNNFD